MWSGPRGYRPLIIEGATLYIGSEKFIYKDDEGNYCISGKAKSVYMLYVRVLLQNVQRTESLCVIGLFVHTNKDSDSG